MPATGFTVLSLQSGYSSLGTSVSRRGSPSNLTAPSYASIAPSTAFRMVITTENKIAARINSWRKQILKMHRFPGLSIAQESTIGEIVAAARTDSEFAGILPPNDAGTYKVLQFMIDRMYATD